MSYGDVYQSQRLNPLGLGIVIALHAAAILALLLAKGPTFIVPEKIRTEIFDVPVPPEPEPIPQPKAQPQNQNQPQHRSVVDVPPSIVERPADGPRVEPGPQRPVEFAVTPPGPVDVLPQPQPRPEPQPVPEPVRVEAQLDPRYASALQPSYPASEQRAEREGSVTIRVTIGTDGRVKAAERVRATSDAFWQATERQALRAWRFRPATVDGRPVEATKTMTVQFRLDDQ